MTREEQQPMAIIIQNRTDLERRLIFMKTREGWSIRALARHFTISLKFLNHL